MKYLFSKTRWIFPIVVAATMTGCAKPDWPADVVVGKTIELGIADTSTPTRGKVLRVEDRWLTVEVNGKPISFPREQVVLIHIVQP